MLFLLVVVCVLLYCIVNLALNSRRPPNFPPGPQGYPLVGNLNLVYGNTKFHETLHELNQEYGSLYSKCKDTNHIFPVNIYFYLYSTPVRFLGLQLGKTSTIVISDVNLMREALLVQADNFSDRPLHLQMIRFVFGGNGEAISRDKQTNKQKSA